MQQYKETTPVTDQLSPSKPSDSAPTTASETVTPLMTMSTTTVTPAVNKQTKGTLGLIYRLTTNTIKVHFSPSL